MQNKFFLFGILISFISSVALGQSYQIGQSQVWTVEPDWAALNAASDPVISNQALRDSMETAANDPLNPAGLTLDGAMDIIREFNLNLDDAFPCDGPLRATADFVTTLSIPYSVLEMIILNEFPCDPILPTIDDPRIGIDPIAPVVFGCLDPACDEWLLPYPCDDCECYATDPATGECVAWVWESDPLLPYFPPPPPSDQLPPGFNDGTGPGDGAPPPGGGGGPVAGGPGDGGGGGSGPGSSSRNSVQAEGCGGSGGDKTSSNGPGQKTANPVMTSFGFKFEEDVDLNIDLPGDDFALRRMYTGSPLSSNSQFPFLLSSGWGVSSDGWVNVKEHSLPWYPLPTTLNITAFPLQESKVFYREDDGNGAWGNTYKPPQAFSNNNAPTNQIVRELSDFYRLESSGSGYTDYMREGILNKEWLAGRIIKQSDAKGNIWNYEYRRVELSSGGDGWARLNRVYFNGTNAINSFAYVQFAWDIGDDQSPGSGLMRGATVFRKFSKPNGGWRFVPTQYVNYTYAADDPAYYHLANNNMLVLVEAGTLVNAPIPGEPLPTHFLADLKYHKRFTHYRYEQNVRGASMLTHRFESEQVEYFAEHWARIHGNNDPVQDYQDAVENLLSRPTDENLIDIGLSEFDVSDLCSKIISYNGDFTVNSELLQAPCGCGGSGENRLITYDIASRYYPDAQITPETGPNPIVTVTLTVSRRSTANKITEHVPDGMDGWIPKRRTISWSEEQKLFDMITPYTAPTPGSTAYRSWHVIRTPFVIGNAVEELVPDGSGGYVVDQRWTSFHEFDLDTLLRTKRYMPSSVEDVSYDQYTGLLNYPGLTPAPFDTATALDAKQAFTLKSNEGLVNWETFNFEGRSLTKGVQHGENGVAIKTLEFEYWPASMTMGRTDLIKEMKEYIDTDGVEYLSTRYAYNLTSAGAGETTASNRVTRVTTTKDREAINELGPGGIVETVEEFGDYGRKTKTIDPDGVVTTYGYTNLLNGINVNSYTDSFLTTEIADSETNPTVSYSGEMILDVMGHKVAMKTSEGVWAYTSWDLETVKLYNNASGSPSWIGQSSLQYLVQTVLPNDLGELESPRFNGPAQKTWATSSGNILRQSKFALSDLVLNDAGTAIDWTLGEEVERSMHLYNLSGSVSESRDWHDLTLPVSIENVSYRKKFTYDEFGRNKSTISHEGVEVLTVYDIMDRPIQTYGGQEGTSITLRLEQFYDHIIENGQPVSSIGEGNKTLTRLYLQDPSQSPLGEVVHRDSVVVFDWRNRDRLAYFADATATNPYATPVSGSGKARLLDNIDRPTEMVTLGTDNLQLLSDELRADTATSLSGSNTASLTRLNYSKRGSVWAVDGYIDPQDTTAGYLRTSTWFDALGRSVISVGSNGSAIKTEYDSIGRPWHALVTDGALARDSSSSYEDIVGFSPALDYVYEETFTEYNAIGKPVLVETKLRSHDATETTGIGLNPVTVYQGFIYDQSQRPVSTITYGTNIAGENIFKTGGAAPVVPLIVPDRDSSGWDETLITETVYDAVGRPYRSIDSEGRIQDRVYDARSRPVATVENVKGVGVDLQWDSIAGRFGIVSRSTIEQDENRTTSYVYDSAGNIVKRVAHIQKNGQEKAQVTEFSYDPSSSNLSENLADTYGNLYAIHYPKPGVGNDPYQDNTVGSSSLASDDSVYFAYNYLAEQIAAKDQVGNIRVFDRDGLGRTVAERVTTFASGVDDFVKQLTTEYDSFGRMKKSQSWSDSIVDPESSGASLRNKVSYTFSNRGDLVQMDQIAMAGTSSRSLKWDYSISPYTDPSFEGSNRFRLEYMEYPDGSRLQPKFGEWTGNSLDPTSNTDDTRVGRIRELWLTDPQGSSDRLVSYDHLGLSTTAIADMGFYQMDRTADEQGNRRFGSNTSTAEGVYPGWDRFGRLSLNSWVHTLWEHDIAQGQPNFSQLQQHKHLYNRVSNRVSLLDLRMTSDSLDRDWEYIYDGLDRLISANQGVNTGSSFAEAPGSKQWLLDELGNWLAIDTLNSGLWSDSSPDTTVKSQIFNAVNELTHEDGTETHEYDANGNLIVREGAPDRRFEYDAWNRLVRVRNGSSTHSPILAEYDYNPLHWRVAKRGPSLQAPATLASQRLMYYSPGWQLIFEDVDLDYNGSHDTTHTALQVWGTRTTDDALARIIDDDGDGIHDRNFSYVNDHQFSTTAVLEDGQVYERLKYDAYGYPTHQYPEDFSEPSGSIDFFDMSEFLTLFNAGDLKADLYQSGTLNIFDITSMTSSVNLKSTMLAGWISDQGASGPDNRIGYAGYVWDPETGFWLARNRVYDPSSGRWLQRDPAGYVDGMSLYLYARGAPTMLVDPMGLCSSGPLDNIPDKYYEPTAENAMKSLAAFPYDKNYKGGENKEHGFYDANNVKDKQVHRHFYDKAGNYVGTLIIPWGDAVAAQTAYDFTRFAKFKKTAGEIGFALRVAGETLVSQNPVIDAVLTIQDLKDAKGAKEALTIAGLALLPIRGPDVPGGKGGVPKHKSKVKDVPSPTITQKLNMAKKAGGISGQSKALRKGKDKHGTKWWEYEDTNGNVKIVVQHSDGSVHVGTPKPHSKHRTDEGPPKYWQEEGTGHIGDD